MFNPEIQKSDLQISGQISPIKRHSFASDTVNFLHLEPPGPAPYNYLVLELQTPISTALYRKKRVLGTSSG